MTIVRISQPRETNLAGSDRPETGFKATSVDSSADSNQFDPSPDLQARERRPFDRQFQRRKGAHGGVRLGTNFAGGRKRQHSSIELLEGPAHFTVADADVEIKSIVNNSDK